MIHFFLIAVFAGPQMLPFPRMTQGSSFSMPPSGQDIAAVHPQFRQVASLLKAGARLSFETKEACAAFVQDEVRASGGAQLVCQASQPAAEDMK